MERRPDRAGSVVPRGTGRIGIIRAYFDIFSGLGAIVTGGLAAALLLPKLGWTVPGKYPILSVASALFMTVGFFRTSQLLRDRRKSGAWLAAGCFLFDIASSTFGGGYWTPSLIMSGVGLALVASIWRHLD